MAINKIIVNGKEYQINDNELKLITDILESRVTNIELDLAKLIEKQAENDDTNFTLKQMTEVYTNYLKDVDEIKSQGNIFTGTVREFVDFTNTLILDDYKYFVYESDTCDFYTPYENHFRKDCVNYIKNLESGSIVSKNPDSDTVTFWYGN